jgi:hypothetical protein
VIEDLTDGRNQRRRRLLLSRAAIHLGGGAGFLSPCKRWSDHCCACSSGQENCEAAALEAYAVGAVEYWPAIAALPLGATNRKERGVAPLSRIILELESPRQILNIFYVEIFLVPLAGGISDSAQFSLVRRDLSPLNSVTPRQ